MPPAFGKKQLSSLPRSGDDEDGNEGYESYSTDKKVKKHKDRNNEQQQEASPKSLQLPNAFKSNGPLSARSSDSREKDSTEQEKEKKKKKQKAKAALEKVNIFSISHINYIL